MMPTNKITTWYFRVTNSLLVRMHRLAYTRGFRNGYRQARYDTQVQMFEAHQRGMTQREFAISGLERDLADMKHHGE